MKSAYPHIPSPCYVLEEKKLIDNLKLLEKVRKATGVKIILALKGYAMWSTFPLIKKYLDGATASSLHEALLIYEEMGVKAHTYAPAYLPEEFPDIFRISSHVTFNSLYQWELYKKYFAHSHVKAGLRINPEYSEIKHDIYNPAIRGSRLGIIKNHLPQNLPEGISGLHFHVMCEQDSYVLERVLQEVEKKFNEYFSQISWLNMGGGHLITHKTYQVEHLIQVLLSFRSKYPWLEIILEPGEAIGWETGFLKSTVLDIVENNGIRTAILDVSFSAHMPDTLEMPYKPIIRGASEPNKYPYVYRMGGVTCLAGDYMGDYSFPEPLQIGDEIIFEDMIHYTMVKTTFFNGVKHPSIGVIKSDGSFQLLRKFTYLDYKNKLS